MKRLFTFGAVAVVMALFFSACAKKLEPWEPGKIYDVPVVARNGFSELASNSSDNALVVTGNGLSVDQTTSHDPLLDLTVPPSNKTTRIRVNKTDKSLPEKVASFFKNDPEYDVQSSSPGIDASQPKKSLWWRWVILILLVFSLSVGIADHLSKMMYDISPVKIFIKFIKSILKIS